MPMTGASIEDRVQLLRTRLRDAPLSLDAFLPHQQLRLALRLLALQRVLTAARRLPSSSFCDPSSSAAVLSPAVAAAHVDVAAAYLSLSLPAQCGHHATAVVSSPSVLASSSLTPLHARAQMLVALSLPSPASRRQALSLLRDATTALTALPEPDAELLCQAQLGMASLWWGRPEAAEEESHRDAKQALNCVSQAVTVRERLEQQQPLKGKTEEAERKEDSRRRLAAWLELWGLMMEAHADLGEAEQLLACGKKLQSLAAEHRSLTLLSLSDEEDGDDGGSDASAAPALCIRVVAALQLMAEAHTSLGDRSVACAAHCQCQRLLTRLTARMPLPASHSAPSSLLSFPFVTSLSAFSPLPSSLLGFHALLHSLLSHHLTVLSSLCLNPALSLPPLSLSYHLASLPHTLLFQSSAFQSSRIALSRRSAQLHFFCRRLRESERSWEETIVMMRYAGHNKRSVSLAMDRLQTVRRQIIAQATGTEQQEEEKHELEDEQQQDDDSDRRGEEAALTSEEEDGDDDELFREDGGDRGSGEYDDDYLADDFEAVDATQSELQTPHAEAEAELVTTGEADTGEDWL